MKHVLSSVFLYFILISLSLIAVPPVYAAIDPCLFNTNANCNIQDDDSGRGACSSHGGVNCTAGDDWKDGSVICRDEWTHSSVPYGEVCRTLDRYIFIYDAEQYATLINDLDSNIAELKSMIDKVLSSYSECTAQETPGSCSLANSNLNFLLNLSKQTKHIRGRYVLITDTPEISSPTNNAPLVSVSDSSYAIAPEHGAYLPTKKDPTLIAKLKGYILLQVQAHGEAWYVNPTDSVRYYMPNGSSAYKMMRSFGLGIATSDLNKIQTVSSSQEMKAALSACSSNSLANRMKGKMLLQVQEHGEAWYVDPRKCKKIYLKDGEAAYQIMRYLGVGIADADLEKIPSGN